MTKTWTGMAALACALAGLPRCAAPGGGVSGGVLELPMLPPVAARSPWRVGGYADYHTHPFADRGFGGQQSREPIVLGDVFEGRGPGADLRPGRYRVMPELGLWSRIEFYLWPHQGAGWPTFEDFPSPYASTQQMHVSSLKRAYEYGLRLLVAHAVNSEGLCDHVAPVGTDCRDMAAVREQLKGASALEGYLSGIAKPGRPAWLSIARNAADARRILEDGRLVWVSGIEVDSLFGCAAPAECGPAEIRAGVKDLDDLGVRHVFIVHTHNNNFAGAAFYDWSFSLGAPERFEGWPCGQFGYAKRAYQFPDCGAEPMGCPWNAADILRLTYGLDRAQQIVHDLGGSWDKAMADTFGNSGTCNLIGLRPAGELLVRELMKRGMIIDLDHLSLLAQNDVLQMAEGVTRVVGREKQRLPYPGLIAGHIGALSAYRGDGAHEGAKGDRILQRLIRLGGLVAANLPQYDQSRTTPYVGPLGTVANDCSRSTKSWAQHYLKVLETVRAEASRSDRVLPAVGLATDFNGLPGPVAPRFGPRACNSDKASSLQTKRLEYGKRRTLGTGITLSNDHTGVREWDFNTDGLAHVGLVPDFIEDARTVGVPDEALEALFHAAEAYVRLWQSTEAWVAACTNSAHELICDIPSLTPAKIGQ